MGESDAFVDNMVLVCHYRGKAWVLENAEWEGDWTQQAMSHMAVTANKFTFDRSRALTLAHNVHNRSNTSKGVWEIFIRKEKEDKHVDVDSTSTDQAKNAK